MDFKQVAKDLLKRVQGDDKRTRLIVIIGLSGIVLLFLSQLIGNKSVKPNETAGGTNDFSAQEYCITLEARLGALIGSIDGAGKTEVMLTVRDSGEVRYLKDEQLDLSKSKSGDGSQTSSLTEHISRSTEYLTLNSTDGKQVMEVAKEEPKIQGVLILCEGGGNPVTQEKIIDAVSKLFGISSARVCVLKLA